MFSSFDNDLFKQAVPSPVLKVPWFYAGDKHDAYDASLLFSKYKRS
jgi:hypothetical protein